MIRIPVNNLVMKADYTLTLSVGAGAIPLNVLLDTGSSMLVVNGDTLVGANGLPYSPAAGETTQLLQKADFRSGSFLAPVLRTLVAVGAEQTVSVPNGNLAVTYSGQASPFGQADGIFGLAYAALDAAYRMPADTWANQYHADQLGLGQQADLDPFVTQAAAAGLITPVFAFAVRRSVTSLALDDPSADPLNNGVFVLGGGTDCTDLYSGTFASAAVVHEQYYNTNLLVVQVGDQSVNVPPAAPGGRVGSNSIIDSGSDAITLDQGLFDKVTALFGAVNPDLAAAIGQAAGGVDQTTIDLTRWPPLRLILQGSDTSQVAVTVAPADYWQFDSAKTGRGKASLALGGDSGMFGGQSILGLPVFGSHFVVFDRTATNGHGAVRFATRA